MQLYIVFLLRLRSMGSTIQISEVSRSSYSLRSSYQIFSRLLLFSSIVQFCLCLAQAALYVSYLIRAFTAHADRTENYFLRISNYSLTCYIIYTLNVS
jgi:hypothetical protein